MIVETGVNAYQRNCLESCGEYRDGASKPSLSNEFLLSDIIIFHHFRYSEHEIPHMYNDGSWEMGDGPLHDPPSEELFLQMKSLHDKTCVHIDLDISDQVQEQFNDFLHARNKYAHSNNDGNGDVNDVVLRVVAKDGKYYMNGVKAPKLTMLAGVTYTFLTDGLAPNHPFKIGDKDESPFNNGVTYNSNTVVVQLPFDIIEVTLTYYCEEHATMGNTIDVVATPPTTYNVTVSGGKYYLNTQINPEIALIRDPI